MPANDPASSLRRLLGISRKPLRFVRFVDSSGNFELEYPEGWDFDHDIAIEDARYTVSFHSKDCLSTFTVAVDANLPARFRFHDYAKKELESPSSGIYTKMVKSIFHGMPAYSRNYFYSSGGRKFHGGGVMFSTGSAVFSLSWGTPESKETEIGAIFTYMKDRFLVMPGFIMIRGFKNNK